MGTFKKNSGYIKPVQALRGEIFSYSNNEIKILSADIEMDVVYIHMPVQITNAENTN